LKFSAWPILLGSGDVVVLIPMSVPVLPLPEESVVLVFGAGYSSAGWYAPPGVDLAAFGERGWL
jgi:hypothetical protein